MIGMQVYLSRQASIAVAAFVGIILATIIAGATFARRDQELQNEFNEKSRVLLSLGDRMPLNSAAKGAADLQLTRLATITAPTETVAASQLSEIILTELKEAGGTVHSIQAETTTDTIDDGLRRLNAQINFDSSMDALQKLLFHLETAMPFIFVDSIVVQPAPTSENGTISAEVLLRVTLVASSYWKDLSAKRGG